MIEALALALEQPQERLDRLHSQIVAGNPELCRDNACPRPVIGKTNRCGFAKGYRIKIDAKCAAKLSDDELAFVISHEIAHVLTGTTNEAGADWLGKSMLIRAGFDGTKASRVFATLNAKERTP